jgi:hydroxyacyl-ACP dehydratase HTD2-like protein with hotdog domain
MDGRAEATVATMDVAPAEVDLFMFSAATWLTHRIHFDRDYARSEGFDDLVVHGPLQGAYLSQMVSGLARDYGGAVVTLSYRHRRPAYCGQLLRCSAVLESITPAQEGRKLEVALRIVVDETVVTSGQAVLLIPDEMPRLPGAVERAG